MIIPFFIPHAGCPHHCVFCDQKRITGAHAWPEPSSVAGVIASMLAAAKAAGPAQVAFYGGSFTALPRSVQQAYLEEVQAFLRAGTVSGIRISTRPDSISPDSIELLQRYHVTTVELGVQSMDDAVLNRSRRGHSAADTARAVPLLRERGLAVGLQLMPGLPGDSAALFLRTVDRVIGLRPDFVRIYPALVIAGTPLATLYHSGRYAPLALDDAVELCARAVDRLTTAGIAVIRLGLQSTAALEQPGTVEAGPYHPAFGQLVASRRMLRALQASVDTGDPSDRRAVFLVHPADLSTAVGHGRANITALRERYPLLSVTIEGDTSVPRGSIAQKHGPPAAGNTGEHRRAPGARYPGGKPPVDAAGGPQTAAAGTSNTAGNTVFPERSRRQGPRWPRSS